MYLKGDLKISTAQSSETGPKPENQDTIGVRIPEAQILPTKGIAAAIADGVSASTKAKLASESAVLNFLNDYFETPESWEVKKAAHRVLTAMNRWLFSMQQGSESALTTFTGLILKSHTGYLFHVGDSRLYRLRGGELEQLSIDHVTPVSEGRTFLARSLGGEADLQVDCRTFELEEEDVFILTTDGIHDQLSPDQMKQVLTSENDLKKIAGSLSVSSADSLDNRSCLILRIDSLPDSDENEVYNRLANLPFPPDLEVGMKLDGYRVDRVLTATKNTQLYLVTEESSCRQMVMKTPSVSFSNDPSYMERFTLEEWVGIRTKHHNLVRAISPEGERSARYYLLEYIRGMTLAQWLERQSEPSLADIMTIISQLISGVRALHRADVLHQDIKPENVLVLPDLTVKVIDYGSCRVGGISEISTPFERHSALGTVDFSAPEYRYGSSPSNRSDLFSIAALTYYLLSKGAHPYGAGWEKASSLHDFLKLRYQSVTRYNAMVPLWLDAALRKSLSAKPDDRHQVMSSFLADLKTPNYDLLSKDDLPYIERNPTKFWKYTAIFLLLLLILSHFIRSELI